MVTSPVVTPNTYGNPQRRRTESSVIANSTGQSITTSRYSTDASNRIAATLFCANLSKILQYLQQLGFSPIITPGFIHMGQPILSQLQAALDQLDQQESQLTSQLTAIQEQRNGLQTVIAMFSPSADQQDHVVPVTIVATSAAPFSENTDAETAQDTASTAPAEEPAPQPSPQPQLKPKAKTSRKPTKSSQKSKGGRSPNWSRYIQEPFKMTPLPDVVANILKAQPKETFKIADVMEIIFKGNLPKTTFLKARNRVSNILSAGARTGEWSRGRGGRYSLSKDALAN